MHLFRCIVQITCRKYILLFAEMEYVPKVGDRVHAHSKGNADGDHTGVYTDWAWFPGKITKVK